MNQTLKDDNISFADCDFFWNRFRDVVENSVQKDVENFGRLFIVLK